MGLSFHQGSTQSPRLGSLTEPSSSILVLIVSTAGTVGTKSSCHREESVAGQGGEFFPLPTASLCLASPDPPDHVAGPARAGLCLPAVPVGICRGVGLHWTLQRGAGVLGRLLGLRRARVQQWCRFIGVEGPAVRVRAGGASSWPMLWNPPEVLQWSVSPRMVVGIKLVPSSFAVRVPETSSGTMTQRIGATRKQAFWLPLAHRS